MANGTYSVDNFTTEIEKKTKDFENKLNEKTNSTVTRIEDKIESGKRTVTLFFNIFIVMFTLICLFLSLLSYLGYQQYLDFDETIKYTLENKYNEYTSNYFTKDFVAKAAELYDKGFETKLFEFQGQINSLVVDKEQKFEDMQTELNEIIKQSTTDSNQIKIDLDFYDKKSAFIEAELEKIKIDPKQRNLNKDINILNNKFDTFVNIKFENRLKEIETYYKGKLEEANNKYAIFEKRQKLMNKFNFSTSITIYHFKNDNRAEEISTALKEWGFIVDTEVENTLPDKSDIRYYYKTDVSKVNALVELLNSYEINYIVKPNKRKTKWYKDDPPHNYFEIYLSKKIN